MVFADICHHPGKYLVLAAIQSLRGLARDPSAAPDAILRPKASRVLLSEIEATERAVPGQCGAT